MVMASSDTLGGSIPRKIYSSCSRNPSSTAPSPCVLIHCVICTGNEMISTAKPILAGLTGFCPAPPYRCLAMAIANAVPTTTSHHGASGGMDNASSQPVSNALLSPTKCITGRLRSLSISASVPSAVRLASAIETRIAGPKCQTYSAMPGSSASSTLSMIAETVSGLLMKGEKSALFFSLLPPPSRFRQFVNMRPARLDLGDFRLLLRGEVFGVLRLAGGGLFPGAGDGRLDFLLHRVCRIHCWHSRLRLFGSLFSGGQLLGLFLFLALETVFAELVAFARVVGGLLILFARTDLALGELKILHQRDMAGADVAACAAFDAVEQAELLRLVELFRLGKPEQIHLLQIRRAYLGAAHAADAGQGGRRGREQFIRCGDDAVARLDQRNVRRRQLRHVTDRTTSHSTRRVNNTRQVAGYGETSRLREQLPSRSSRTRGLRPTALERQRQPHHPAAP